MQRNKPLETILALTLSLLVFFWITQHKTLMPFTGTKWLLPVAVFFICIGLFSKFLSNKIHLAWLNISLVISQVTTPILCILVFYFILLPLSILSRIFTKKDSLQLKKSTHQKASYYKVRNHTYKSSDFEETW